MMSVQCMKISRFPVLLILLAGLLLSAFAGADVVQTVGDMKLLYSQSNGFQLFFHDIPIIKGSSLWVVKPDWSAQFYGASANSELLGTATIEDVLNGKRVTLRHQQTGKTLPSH